MTLQSLRIQTFKCFRKMCLPVAPLTVMTGFNAAGKSTALQSLLLMTQALRQTPSMSTLPLNGPLVRLGTAAEIVSRDADASVNFSV